MGLDYGIKENNCGEEAWVHEREVAEHVGS